MYPIIKVSDDASDLPEQLGTKPKFWFKDESGRWCLFKEGRPNSGENWAEKICCELCEILGIPHAHYDFAIWRQLKGVVSPTFVPDGGRLILGNELLAKMIKGYEHEKQFRVKQHTIQAVFAIMRGAKMLMVRVPKTIIRDPKNKARVQQTMMNPVASRSPRTVVRPAPIGMPLGYQPPDALKNAADVFVSYLMLDALVANQDRHHENWGLILSREGSITLVPTFDHASSLGRNELDEERVARLTTKDRGRSVEAYVDRARSAFYGSSTSDKPLTTLAAFQEAAKLVPEAHNYWLGRLRSTSLADYERIFQNVPPTEMTNPARDFALKMLEINRNRILQN